MLTFGQVVSRFSGLGTDFQNSGFRRSGFLFSCASMQGGASGGGRQRKAGAAPSAPQPKKVKAASSASQWDGGEARKLSGQPAMQAEMAGGDDIALSLADAIEAAVVATSGRQRKAGTEPSQASRPKKAKTAGSSSHRHGWLSFEAARTFVRTLGLGSHMEWKQYSKSSRRPSNIPGDPAKMYRDAGWISMPDWLGYEGRQMMAPGSALSFEAARTFVRKLKMGGEKEWLEYSKSGKRPYNIPGCPHQVYRDAGWISLPDWLGYESKVTGREEQEVKEVEEGGEAEEEDWDEDEEVTVVGDDEDDLDGQDGGGVGEGGARARAAVKLSKRSTMQDEVQDEDSRVGGRQWKAGEEASQAPWPTKVKTARSASQWHGGKTKWLSFEAARAFVRTLELGSQIEWKAYTKSGKRPSNIPSNPYTMYRDAGWISMPDWLGYGGQSEGGAAR